MLPRGFVNKGVTPHPLRWAQEFCIIYLLSQVHEDMPGWDKKALPVSHGAPNSGACRLFF